MPHISAKSKILNAKNQNAAFSLIEVVIAIGITSFCLVATLGLLGNGFSTASAARDRTAVSTIATRTFASVARQLAAGNDPAQLVSAEELFDAEGRPLTGSADSDLWAYRSNLRVSPISAGSTSQNGFILRAEVEVHSRSATQRIYQYFASNSPSTP